MDKHLEKWIQEKINETKKKLENNCRVVHTDPVSVAPSTERIIGYLDCLEDLVKYEEKQKCVYWTGQTTAYRGDNNE